MARYHCTVEFREADGLVQQHVVDLDAPDGDQAAAQAEMELMKARGSQDTETLITVEQVVCWLGDHP